LCPALGFFAPLFHTRSNVNICQQALTLNRLGVIGAGIAGLTRSIGSVTRAHAPACPTGSGEPRPSTRAVIE